MAGRSTSGFPARLLAWADRFNPPDLREDELLRARLVTFFTASVIGWIPVFGTASALLMHAWRTGVAITICGFAMGVAPCVMRRWGIRAGGNVTAASIFATALVSSLLNGGPELHSHMTLSLVPVIAASLAGIRSAVHWVLVILTATIGMFALHAGGFVFPADMPVENRPLFQLMSACTLYIILGCCVVLYEYTRSEVTRALRAREEDLAAIIDTAQDSLLVIGGDRIQRVNPAAERLFGARGTSLQGSRVEVLFPGGIGLENGVRLTDVPSRKADGSAFPADVSVGVLATAGGERYVAIVRDVSERHEAARAIAEARDRAIRASLAKSTFLANMSHELRTPLNAILGYAELIDEEIALGTTVGVQVDLGRIGAAGRHLLSLIDHLLDLSKIEAGKLVLERSLVRLDELMEEVLTTIRPLVKAQGNTLACVLPEPLGTVVSDPLRLRQILLNLLSNAAKFTENGTVGLRVERVSPEGRSERIRFVVTDSGIGMTDDQVENLFQDFVQADATTTRKFGGTGLGLAITRRIVRMMGGEVTAESQPGAGSTFTVEIPTQAPLLALATPSPLLMRGGVLIVDEDGWAREALARTVSGAGIPVAIAPDATIGVELAQRLRPKLVVVDLLSPGREGWLVLQRLRESPVTRDIPVVGVTMQDDRNLALALGASHLVDDRSNGDQLLEVIRRLLQTQIGHALVVEDDTALREILGRTLGKAGWSVTVAADGEQALLALEQSVPDVIITDLMMPNVDGFEFVSRLRAMPTHRNVPVVIVTARDLTTSELQRLAGQADRILQKGDRPASELLAEIVRLVSERRAAAQPA